MSITKLKWQWQSSAPNPNDLSCASSARLQYGRVITGMLTGSDFEPQPHHTTTTRSSGGSDRTKY
jgi:hypothetical protein